MNIVVIVKRINAPSNASPSQKVLDVGDKIALDMAIGVREKCGVGNSHVSALCIAPVEDSDVIRECYSLGADVGYLLSDPLFEQLDLDGLIGVLSSSALKIDNCDVLVMVSASNDAVTIDVGRRLAEMLKFKHASNVDAFDCQGNSRIVVKRANPKNGPEREVIELPVLINLNCDSPLVVHNAMRIMKAFKKEVKIWTHKDLNVDSRKPQNPGIPTAVLHHKKRIQR